VTKTNKTDDPVKKTNKTDTPVKAANKTVAAATVFKSALTIAVSDPAEFVKDIVKAKEVVGGSIADSSPDLEKKFVNVTEVTVNAAGRRLSVIARRLAGSINAKFTITFPAGHSKPVLTSSSMNTTKLVR
jgi:hypothetical protein